MELASFETLSAEIEVRGIQSVGVAVPGIQCVGFEIQPDEVEIQSVAVGIPSAVRLCSYPGAGSCWLGSDQQTPQVKWYFAVEVAGVAPC